MALVSAAKRRARADKRKNKEKDKKKRRRDEKALEGSRLAEERKKAAQLEAKGQSVASDEEALVPTSFSEQEVLANSKKFWGKRDKFASFLLDADLESAPISKKSKTVPTDKLENGNAPKPNKVSESEDESEDSDLSSDEEQLASYEKQPRKSFKGEGAKPGLPIKDTEGNWKVTKRDLSVKPSDQVVESESDDEGEEEEAPKQRQHAKPKVEIIDVRTLSPEERKERLQAKKMELAVLSEQILEDPEAATNKPNLFHKLQALHKHETDTVVLKYLFLSQLAVFKDVLPGYRIRLPTAKEKKMLVTKEVRLLRKFEKALLDSYQLFLQNLQKAVDRGVTAATYHEGSLSTEDEISKSQRSLGHVAIRCMCTLLVTKPYFNFRDNLLATIVPLMNCADDEVSDQCIACVGSALKADLSGDTTVEIIRLVAKIMQANSHGATGRMRANILNIFLRLPLSADLKDFQRAQMAKERKKKMKKSRKSGDEVSAGLEEAKATQDTLLRHARQAESLRELFVMYLRVLKRAPQSALLPVVLEGVMRYVHLINIDIVESLLNVLGKLAKTDQLGVKAGLHCILAVIITLQGPGRELQIDESEIAGYLYKLLTKMVTVPNAHADTMLALRCVDAMLLRRRQFSAERVGAFCRKLMALALFFPPNCAIAMLTTTRALISRYPGCKQLLEDESDRVGSLDLLGLPQDVADVGDLEHSNAFGSSAWELTLLRMHWHPMVRQTAQELMDNKPLMPDQKAHLMLQRYDVSEGGFNPPVQAPPQEKAQGKRKRRGFHSRPSKEARTLEDEQGVKCFGGDKELAKVAVPVLRADFRSKVSQRRQQDRLFALKREWARFSKKKQNLK